MGYSIARGAGQAGATDVTAMRQAKNGVVNIAAVDSGATVATARFAFSGDTAFST